MTYESTITDGINLKSLRSLPAEITKIICTFGAYCPCNGNMNKTFTLENITAVDSDTHSDEIVCFEFPVINTPVVVHIMNLITRETRRIQVKNGQNYRYPIVCQNIIYTIIGNGNYSDPIVISSFDYFGNHLSDRSFKHSNLTRGKILSNFKMITPTKFFVQTLDLKTFLFEEDTNELYQFSVNFRYDDDFRLHDENIYLFCFPLSENYNNKPNELQLAVFSLHGELIRTFSLLNFRENKSIIIDWQISRLGQLHILTHGDVFIFTLQGEFLNNFSFPPSHPTPSLPFCFDSHGKVYTFNRRWNGTRDYLKVHVFGGCTMW